jgi:hypothetical protein
VAHSVGVHAPPRAASDSMPASSRAVPCSTESIPAAISSATYPVVEWAATRARQPDTEMAVGIDQTGKDEPPGEFLRPGRGP